MSRPRWADEHVCVGPLAHWHTIPWHINSCLRWDCHYGFCVACFQGLLPGNVGFFSDLCFCTYATIGQHLWLMAVMLKTAENQSITQRQRKKNGEGRKMRKGWEGYTGGGTGNTVLHCFKGLVVMMGCCQAPCLNSHGGNQSHVKLIYGHGRGENGPPSSCTDGLLLIRDTRMLNP